LAIGRNGRPNLRFTTWPILFRFRAVSSAGRRDWLYPDGLLKLKIGTDRSEIQLQRFYLEVDRGTESLSVLGRKAAAYLLFSQTGHASKPLPFRVLWVFRRDARRDHAATQFRTQYPPVLTQAWLSTFDRVLADPLGSTWSRPIDEPGVELRLN
jgi:hypothetical protein